MPRQRGWGLPWRRIWLAALGLGCLFAAFSWAVGGSGDALGLVWLVITGVAWLGFTMDAHDEGCLSALATMATLCLGALSLLA
jgi:hypothetical protein